MSLQYTAQSTMLTAMAAVGGTVTMAVPAIEIREWLDSFAEGDLIAIDEGGLALVGLTPSGAPTTAYIEVGGVPAAEDCE